MKLPVVQPRGAGNKMSVWTLLGSLAGLVSSIVLLLDIDFLEDARNVYLTVALRECVTPQQSFLFELTRCCS